MMKLAAALTLAVALCGCNPRPDGAAPEQSSVDAPKPAPEFELENILGGTLKSADIKGKVAIIDFWATWCQPCIVEIPTLNEIHKEHDGKGVQMLGITVLSGDIEEIKPKVQEFKMQYPVVVGNDDVVDGFGGIIGWPTTFIVTKDWKIYKRYLGYTAGKKDQIKRDIETLLAQQTADAR